MREGNKGIQEGEVDRNDQKEQQTIREEKSVCGSHGYSGEEHERGITLQERWEDEKECVCVFVDERESVSVIQPKGCRQLTK